MRFLKNKILRAQEALQRKIAKQSSNINPSETLDDSSIMNLIKIEEETETGSPLFERSGSHRSPLKLNNNALDQGCQTQRSAKTLIKTYDDYSYESHKNIAVNYGKAIAKFATSHLAVPYLEALVGKNQDFQDYAISTFQKFVNQNKSKIGGVSSLRSLLLITEEDNKEVAQCKRLFQAIGEIFIKYFSVNWIITGKLSYKLLYLRFRVRMLRRIQNPESFTYIVVNKQSKGKKRAG